MIVFTREEFKKEFGKPPGALFDLTKCLEDRKQMEVEALGQPDPNLMRVRTQYGTLIGRGRASIIYALDVGYWIEAGRFKAIIEKVRIFDDQVEQDLHKALSAATAPNWQDN